MKNAATKQSPNKLYIVKKPYVYYLLLTFFLTIIIIKIATQHKTVFPLPHISNFGISGAVMLLELRKYMIKDGYSNSRLYTGASIGVAVNVIVETMLNIGDIPLPGNVTFSNFNTTDPLDMLMGILAIILVMIVIKLNSILFTVSKK